MPDLVGMLLVPEIDLLLTSGYSKSKSYGIIAS